MPSPAARSARHHVLVAVLAMAAVLVPAVPASAGRFVDVPGSHTFTGNVERLAAAGITRGCNPPANDRFCPEAFVTRGQMAAFLDRALGLPDGTKVFADTSGHVFRESIAALARAGITRGCNPPTNDRFCPDAFVTRGQMAAFLDRALGLPDAVVPFSDADGHLFGSSIAALARAGITRGCNPPANTRFCPDAFVTRGQMAAFLDRAGLTTITSRGDGGSTGTIGTGTTDGSGASDDSGSADGGPTPAVDAGSDTGDTTDPVDPTDPGTDPGDTTDPVDPTDPATDPGDTTDPVDPTDPGTGDPADGSDPTDPGTGDGGDQGGLDTGGGAGGDDPGGGSSVVWDTLSAGKDHTCAVRPDTTVACWGMNYFGQTGDGTSYVTATSPLGRSTPVTVVGLSGIDAVAAGDAHSCALRADGVVLCWGSNLHGELGDGTSKDDGTSSDVRLSPVEVQGLSDAVAIAAGNGHTCAIRDGGTVVCWGYDQYGSLGDGQAGLTDGTRSHATPVTVPGVGDAVAIAASGLNTCVLQNTGSVLCWGDNTYGQVGDGTSSTEGTSTVARATPTAVSGITDATAIAAGTEHACAVRTGGTVSCWGRNQTGALGDGTSVAEGTSPAVRSTPVTVSGLSGVVAITGGQQHTCAATSDGSAWCWGWNVWGQLGTGSAGSTGGPSVRSTPVRAEGITDAAAMGGGWGHACALLSTGEVMCWGSNTYGQVGDGTSSLEGTSAGVRPTPTPVGFG